MGSRRWCVTMVFLVGCMQPYSRFQAAPLGRGGVEAGLTVGGYSGNKPKDLRYDKAMAVANLDAMYGVAPSIDAGGSIGTSGIAGRFRFGFGTPRAAFAFMPSVHVNFRGIGLDGAALATFGPITLVGFYGKQAPDAQTGAFAMYGGGVGVTLGRWRAGLEAQRWPDPMDFQFVLFQVGYVVSTLQDR